MLIEEWERTGCNLREMNSTRIERKDSRSDGDVLRKKKKKYGSLTVDNREENKLEGWAKGFNTVECG